MSLLFLFLPVGAENAALACGSEEMTESPCSPAVLIRLGIYTLVHRSLCDPPRPCRHTDEIKKGTFVSGDERIKRHFSCHLLLLLTRACSHTQ